MIPTLFHSIDLLELNLYLCQDGTGPPVGSGEASPVLKPGGGLRGGSNGPWLSEPAMWTRRPPPCRAPQGFSLRGRAYLEGNSCPQGSLSLPTDRPG